jgi:hypothetical protein
MALNSTLDKDGKVDKSKNDAQYKNINPEIKGGDKGSRTNGSEGIKDGKQGKLFAGRS